MLKFVKQNRIGVLDKMLGLDIQKLDSILDSCKEGKEYELIIQPISEPKTHRQVKAWYRGVGLAMDYMVQNETNVTLDFKGRAIQLPLVKESVDLFLKQRVALPILGYIPSKADMKKDEFNYVLNRLDMWLNKYMDINLFPEVNNG